MSGSAMSILITLCQDNATRTTELTTQLALLQKQLTAEIVTLNERINSLEDEIKIINSRAETEKKELDALMATSVQVSKSRPTIGRLI